MEQWARWWRLRGDSSTTRGPRDVSFDPRRRESTLASPAAAALIKEKKVPVRINGVSRLVEEAFR